MTISLSVFQFTAAAPQYRPTITAADSVVVNPAAFTTTQQLAAPTVTGAIPVLAATGFPSLFAEARFTTAGDSIGLSPVALNIDSAAKVTVLGIGSELLANASALRDLASTGKYFSQALIASSYGPRSGAAFGAGLVTHVAWLVTTAPAGSTNLYAWLSG